MSACTQLENSPCSLHRSLPVLQVVFCPTSLSTTLQEVNEVTVEQLVQQHPHITFSTVLQDCKRTLERAYQMGWTPNMSAASS
ncbi:F-box/LRR-repeat protein 17 [Cricetulus griseus]|uniref:F-box/LRR-repeat protein 17 n=1 Tax=Cricetulus griseus TaxID=10029 RepID=A0A098KXA1_CRIGR|nr:F-box/LRR-repeat protein 17 [Cricetulus griseus]